ncbi:MAG TPA: PDZ domain-containing protein [Gemmatimonadales bacterium]|nr:PDZ domain-containing protein [Gemmatimonadales bacterium]
MRHSMLLAAAVAAAGLVLTGQRLSAQDTSASDRPRRLERRLEEPDRLVRIVMNRRARLGIKVNLQARDTDSLGAYVESVLPNGPAAKAGIRSGDVITKLDGKSVLAGGRAEQEADRAQSLPGLRLIELAARLEPADTVPVEFLHGKARRTVSVVTEDEPDSFSEGPRGERPFTMRFFRPGPGGDHMPHPAGDFMDIGPDRFEFMAGSPLGDLELAPLNPDLGQYFGANDGVLVIQAPKDGSLGLKGGDVVQAVDGRKPAGPAHLMRILRSYDRGETFKLDILRNRKRETVTARLGERER